MKKTTNILTILKSSLLAIIALTVIPQSLQAGGEWVALSKDNISRYKSGFFEGAIYAVAKNKYLKPDSGYIGATSSSKYKFLIEFIGNNRMSIYTNSGANIRTRNISDGGEKYVLVKGSGSGTSDPKFELVETDDDNEFGLKATSGDTDGTYAKTIDDGEKIRVGEKSINSYGSRKFEVWLYLDQ